MAKRKIIPVSITNEKILNHLETKENVSQYIRTLIKRDMEKKIELDPKIKNFIEEYIKNNFKNIKVEDEQTEDEDLEMFKGAIDDIFNLE